MPTSRGAWAVSFATGAKNPDEASSSTIPAAVPTPLRSRAEPSRPSPGNASRAKETTTKPAAAKEEEGAEALLLLSASSVVVESIADSSPESLPEGRTGLETRKPDDERRVDRVLASPDGTEEFRSRKAVEGDVEKKTGGNHSLLPPPPPPPPPRTRRPLPPPPRPQMHVFATAIKDNDVLFGRGGETTRHAGNVRFRSLVKSHRRSYLAATRQDKPKVAGAIVDIVRSWNPTGRFLKRDAGSGRWRVMGDQKAREKTSRALRVGGPEIRDASPPVPAIVEKTTGGNNPAHKRGQCMTPAAIRARAHRKRKRKGEERKKTEEERKREERIKLERQVQRAYNYGQSMTPAAIRSRAWYKRKREAIRKGKGMN